jgi:hypothetical protein
MAARGLADEPATQPDADDPPVSAEIAPTYIAIGRDVSLRLSLLRRTLDDLTLEPSVRTQANQLVESLRKEVDGMVTQMCDGPMPSCRMVLSEPGNLRAGKQALDQIIGPDQSTLLDEMLRSLRGEARSTLGHVRLLLENLKDEPDQLKTCMVILRGADAEAESLPHTDVPDADYDAQHKRLDDLLMSVRNKLTSVLSPADLARLGPKFDQLLPPPPAPAGAQ